MPHWRERFPGMSRIGMLWYRFCRFAAASVLQLLYRPIRLHTDRIPLTGPVLLVANHQSHLDPPAISVCLNKRACAFLARESLFKNRLFGWLIGSLNSIPIKRDATDTAGMKATLEALAEGKPILVFPEGTRSEDGEVQPFKRGVALLIKRSDALIVPIGIHGSADAWPKGKSRPFIRGKRIAIAFGAPLDPEQLMQNGADNAIETLRNHIIGLHQEAIGALEAHRR